MRRDAVVAPKCLLRSIVIRKKGWFGKGAWDERERKRKERIEGREGREGTKGRVIMVNFITTRSSPNNARSPVEYGDNGTNLTCSNTRLHLCYTGDST